jgi:adenylate kinase family enzyme
MAEGGLVPFELTVQILINGLIANPSKNYLIDGFPRAVEQAIYFEQNVCECQCVLFYDVNEDTLMERCLVRASQAAVQREDDNAETLRKRLQAFNDSSKPVVDLYNKFGKVRHIDASQSIATVYDETRRAVIPEVFFIIGPPKSGKKNLGQALAERTNMSQLFFDQFLSENSLNGKSDEAIVNSLIKYLVDQPATRVLLYEFPQNETQAKYFMKNCRNPSNVFYVKCSKDDCQERMLEVGKDSPDYLPSSILSKKIRNFNEHAEKLLPLLRNSPTKFLELDTSA